jgi:hypothetical protein
MEENPNVYVISVVETRKRNGIEQGWLGEQVEIAKPVVATVQRREFSRSRTALVTVGTIAAMVAVRAALWGPGGVFGGANPGPRPGPQ